MSHRDNSQNEIYGLARLVAYKIRQLELLEKSGAPEGADTVHLISNSLLRERSYAETIAINPSPDIHEEAMRNYYFLLESMLSRRLEKEKKVLAEQILIHHLREEKL